LCLDLLSNFILWEFSKIHVVVATVGPKKNKITKRFSSKMFIDFITTYQKPVSCMLTL
jgi:hypothetical protein